MRLAIFGMLCGLGLAACQTPELLLARDGTVPSGVDFSGDWRLLNDNREAEAAIRDAIRQTDDVKDDAVFNRPSRQGNDGRRRSRGVDGGLVYVFFEFGENLKLTQTADGLFVSFDRSVVEEYRFGEQRMVNVGQVQAQRVTGWAGNALVVETLDRNGMKLTEQWQLQRSGEVLERTVTFRSKKLDEVEVVLRYRPRER